MQPFISVIIPVYNIEWYIGKCLDSVIGQTLKDIEIIVVDDGSTDNSLDIITQYARKDSRIVAIHKTNGGVVSARNCGKIFDSFHRNIDYLVSPVSYYRYIIPELYPQLDKALYLDGDLVVNGSLEKLWDTDITDYLCAGAHDLWVENINYKRQIGFSSDELYINAGVLLLNIPKMREEKIYEKLCETTISLGKQIQFQDQDIINIVCRGRVKELPERYNFTTENAIKHPEERDKAVIVHYTGKMKPWSIWDCPNPQSRLYFDYLKKTPYKNDIWSYRLKRSKYKIVRRFKKIFGIKSH